MYPTGYVLKHDVDFDNCMYCMIPVEVYEGDKLLHRGYILRHSEFAVRFAPDDRGFVKVNKEFRVKTLEDIRREQEEQEESQ